MVGSPKVSVICIFYNAERFMEEALDSVLSQDFEDFELLLIDDGSSDGSSEIARARAAERPSKVRYFEHDRHQNRGMSASRNLGIRHAKGELIAFIDADDVWLPAKLAEQVALLDEHRDVAMLCGTVNYWRSWGGGKDRLVPTGHVLDRRSPPPQAAFDVYPLGMSHAACPSDILVRRSEAERVGGFEEEFTGLYEDLVLYVKIFLSRPVWFSSRTWLNYRLHSGSCSASVTVDQYRAARRKFLDWLAAYLEEQSVADREPVERAIRRARWEMDHLVAGPLARRLRLLRRRIAAR